MCEAASLSASFILLSTHLLSLRISEWIQLFFVFYSASSSAFPSFRSLGMPSMIQLQPSSLELRRLMITRTATATRTTSWVPWSWIPLLMVKRAHGRAAESQPHQQQRLLADEGISLGSRDGRYSFLVASADDARKVFSGTVAPGVCNPVSPALLQLLTARLNMASGSDASMVVSELDALDLFLARNDWVSPEGYATFPSGFLTPLKAAVRSLAQFNMAASPACVGLYDNTAAITDTGVSVAYDWPGFPTTGSSNSSSRSLAAMPRALLLPRLVLPLPPLSYPWSIPCRCPSRSARRWPACSNSRPTKERSSPDACRYHATHKRNATDATQLIEQNTTHIAITAAAAALQGSSELGSTLLGVEHLLLTVHVYVAAHTNQAAHISTYTS